MTLRHVAVRAQVEIAAQPSQVWEAITGDVSAWWGAPYLLLPDTRSIQVDPRLGGLVYEEAAESSGLWGQVTLIEPLRAIEWTGPQGMGPTASGTVRISVADSTEHGTTVTLEHEAIGAFGEGTQASYDHGWRDLLNRLRILLESGDSHGVSGLNGAPGIPE